MNKVFGELWKNRIRAHLIGLQEGLFDHWSFGRIVLVGDSAHKVRQRQLRPLSVLANNITIPGYAQLCARSNVRHGRQCCIGQQN